MSWCRVCKHDKSLDAMKRNRHKPTGRDTICKPCHADRVTTYRPRPDRRFGRQPSRATWMNVPRLDTPRVADLRWAAGFLEGEGSFSGGYNGHTVAVPQVNREPLEWLVRWFGGRIMPVPPRRSTQSPAFTWYVTGPRARGVMMTLYGFLSQRRQSQIRWALLPTTSKTGLKAVV